MSKAYKKLFKRNIGILTEKEQAKVRKTRLAVLGCGGGSEIARQLVQSGFENLLLADYDKVELHNLNRQFYFQKDIGRNKAMALSENLRAINPGLRLEIITAKVTAKTVTDIVESSPIIVDALPPESSLKEEIALSRQVRRSKNKYHLYFMDIVWGAKAIVFSAESQTFEEFMGLKPDCDLVEADKLSLEDLTKNYLVGASPEMVRVAELMYRQELDSFPQMAVTVALAGAMVATLCLFIAIGKEIQLAPRVYQVDFYKEFTKVI